MIKLTKKHVKFTWDKQYEEAFKQLKYKFILAPVLMNFDAEREIIIKTDSSDYVSARIISQYNNNRILHPMAYFSKKHSPTEYNHKIYDKKLMAII